MLVYYIGDRMKKLVYIIMCAWLAGCSAPRSVQEGYSRHNEADTVWMQQQVDAQLSRWQAQMQQIFSEQMEHILIHQQQNEQQQEKITETITETVDSLGRRVRQEQRSISRDASRDITLSQEYITRQLESRLKCSIDSINSLCQVRYDSLAARVYMADSASIIKTPVGDSRPLMDRILDHAMWLVFGAVMVVVFMFLIKRQC